MKNIQVIDGARNAKFEIYAISDRLFRLMFPAGTDIAFLQEVRRRLRPVPKEAKNLYRRPVDKKTVRGIHGSFVLEGANLEPKFFPTRREAEVIDRAPFPPGFRP